jgi:alginate O-acetyltransferase complex protein AlgJ
MLLLPTDQMLFPPERVTTSMVMRLDGRLWRSQRDAEVLLLGDSFSNIYSDSTLGWGSGAGLAEQLGFHLQRPVDKLALNAGGALATRQALQRTLATGEDRLVGKKVVIYQFATRELVSGDWRILR